MDGFGQQAPSLPPAATEDGSPIPQVPGLPGGGMQADPSSQLDLSGLVRQTQDNIIQNKASMVAADLQAQEDDPNQPSLFDRLGDYATKGIPLTGAAVVNSFVNTAVELGNFAGGDFHKLSIEDEFGQDSPTTDYYNRNAGLIEGTALLAGSLIPGLAATKALKLATASGVFGETFSAATGFFSGVRQGVLDEAIGDAAGNSAGNSLFGTTLIQKSKAIAGGIGDNALQGAIYQTATLATMHASPLLDQNTISDDVKDVASSALQFGIVGGLIDGVQALRFLKKGDLAQDARDKAQELVGVQGKGNITPGDRLIGLISQKQETPVPAGPRGVAVAKSANDVYNRNLQANFTELAGKNDPELGQAFGQFVTKQVDSGLTGDALGDSLGQLRAVGRWSDTNIASASQDVAYVPDKIDFSKAGPITKFALQDLMTPFSNKESGTLLSKAYQLRTPGVIPIVAHALEKDDTGLVALADVGAQNLGSLAPKYKGAMDAYSKGVDIFIDATGKTHVNPSNTSALQEISRPGLSRILTKAERTAYTETGNLPAGSKPLNSSAVFLNLKDGTQYGEAPLPVVGDIAKPLLRDKGLQVGDDFYKYPAPAGQEFAPTSPLDANRQYVFYGMRGVQEGDVYHPENLPQLEALYTATKKYETDFPGAEESYPEAKDVSFTDSGPEIPQTSSDLLVHINDVKYTRLLDLLAAGKNADEIGYELNVPQSFLTKGADPIDPTSSMIPFEDHTKINTVRLQYDIGNTKDQAGNLLRGMQATDYRYQLAVQAATDATANYLNKTLGGGQQAVDALSNLKINKTAGDATLIGAGEGPIFSANSDYGTIGQQFERVGRVFNDLQLLRHTAVNEALAPSLLRIKNNPSAAGDWGAFTFARRSTNEPYAFLDPAIAAKNNLPENTAVLQNAITYKKGVQNSWNSDYKPDGFSHGAVSGDGLKTYYSLGKDVADVERTHASLLGQRNELRDNFYTAQGLAPKAYNPETLYAPPINTARTPYFAFVKQREGYALGSTDTRIIVGKDAGDLRQKISQLPDNLVALTKDNIKEFKKAQGEYDYNRNFTSVKINSDLEKVGVLKGFAPENRADNLINDLVSFHRNQETLLLRDHIELNNAKLFAQLDAMGERWQSTANSTFGGIGQGLSKQLAGDNPYATYTRTALGVSSKDNYPFWGAAQDKLEAFAGTAYRAAQEAFGLMRKGVITPEQAAQVSTKFGLGNPYGEAMKSLTDNRYYGGLANRLPDSRILSRVVATANTILNKTVIALDPLQQLVHAVTLLIMSALEYTGATKGLQDLLNSELPIASQAAGAAPTVVPSFARVFYNAMGEYWKEADPEFQALRGKLGLPRDQIFQQRRMLDELSVPPGPTDAKTWSQKIDSAGKIAETLSGTKLVNEFNHTMSAHMGYQLAKAKGLTGQDLVDDVGTFVNRVLGNRAAGQRGAIFHGPVGQAIGLFQSYQFNLMQQVFRHVEEGNYKALALGTGLQSTIFGLSSLPGFNHLNALIQQHSGNTAQDDIYSNAIRALGSKTADYLLYGSLSGLTGAALFSRGDINPRRATIIPTNPLDIPSVAAGIRIYQNVAQLASNISKGGSVPASLMLALEHNGLSRPLGGLAELMQGYSTDAKGQLVSSVGNSSPGFSDLFSVANMSRLLGAKPLDEAVAMNALYAKNAVKAADQVKLQQLGDAFKTQVYSNNQAAPETAARFASEYAAVGGRVNEFNSWMLDQTNKAHTPAVNKVFNHLGSDPGARNAMIKMGGQPLPSYVPQQEDTGSLGMSAP